MEKRRERGLLLMLIGATAIFVILSIVTLSQGVMALL